MAEFCLNCFNHYILSGKEKVTEDDVVMQWDVCEGCKQNKPCVLYVKTNEQKEFEKERELDD